MKLTDELITEINGYSAELNKEGYHIKSVFHRYHILQLLKKKYSQEFPKRMTQPGHIPIELINLYDEWYDTYYEAEKLLKKML